MKKQCYIISLRIDGKGTKTLVTKMITEPEAIETARLTLAIRDDVSQVAVNEYISGILVFEAIG